MSLTVFRIAGENDAEKPLTPPGCIPAAQFSADDTPEYAHPPHTHTHKVVLLYCPPLGKARMFRFWQGGWKG